MRIRDHRPTPPEARRQLLLRDPEVQQELLVGGRFLERVQVLTMHVLEERIAEHLIVLGGADRWPESAPAPPLWPHGPAAPP
jgi:hypothetical protein